MTQKNESFFFYLLNLRVHTPKNQKFYVHIRNRIPTLSGWDLILNGISLTLRQLTFVLGPWDLHKRAPRGDTRASIGAAPRQKHLVRTVVTSRHEGGGAGMYGWHCHGGPPLSRVSMGRRL
jgi:hypothetical protein